VPNTGTPPPPVGSRVTLGWDADAVVALPE
jgi:hypothetical protein